METEGKGRTDNIKGIKRDGTALKMMEQPTPKMWCYGTT